MLVITLKVALNNKNQTSKYRQLMAKEKSKCLKRRYESFTCAIKQDVALYENLTSREASNIKQKQQ